MGGYACVGGRDAGGERCCLREARSGMRVAVRVAGAAVARQQQACRESGKGLGAVERNESPRRRAGEEELTVGLLTKQKARLAPEAFPDLYMLLGA